MLRPTPFLSRVCWKVQLPEHQGGLNGENLCLYSSVVVCSHSRLRGHRHSVLRLLRGRATESNESNGAPFLRGAFCLPPLVSGIHPLHSCIDKHGTLLCLQRHPGVWSNPQDATNGIFVLKTAAMSEQRLTLAVYLPKLIKQQQAKVAKGEHGQKVSLSLKSH